MLRRYGLLKAAALFRATCPSMSMQCQASRNESESEQSQGLADLLAKPERRRRSAIRIPHRD